jgi:WD40 repeat protein/serine/threonine protein kinase/tetratricopeptide (TPR) repeat protein
MAASDAPDPMADPVSEDATRYRQAAADPDATGAPAAPAPPEDGATVYRQVVDAEATGYTANTPQAANRRHLLPCRFGDYELLEEIARGGMGVVYKARQQIGGGERIVALKRINAEQLASTDSIERFLREARAAAALDHPHIVPIYDIGEADGQHYFTMQMVEGGSLATLLRSGPLPPRVAARLVRQVAEAVQHAHERGVIHRDLKPGNILVQKHVAAEHSDVAEKGSAENARQPPSVKVADPPRSRSPALPSAPSSGSSAPSAADTLVPKVADFGLARTRESELSVTGEALGTPSYMPPEQARGRKEAVGPASDVYGLGAVLYALLTGRPPFQTADPVETMRQVCEEEPVPLRQLNPGVPRDLETVCLKCLQKEPSRRYTSAAELALELGRYERGEPVQARPIGRLERAWRWCKRNPTVAKLTISLALFVLVVAVGSSVAAVYFRILAKSEQQAREDADATSKTNLELAKSEKQAKETAQQKEKESLDRLERQYVVEGVRLLEEKDPLAALTRLVEPLKLREKDPQAQLVHRVRVAAVLQQAPRPIHIWFHDGEVNAAEFSRDSRHVVTAGQDGKAQVWNAVTGLPVGSPIQHADPPRKRFGSARPGQPPLDMQFVSAPPDPDAPPPLAAPAPREPDGRIYHVSFSPSGESLLTVSDRHGTRIWDVPSGRPITPYIDHPKPFLTGNLPSSNQAWFSPDGKLVVTAGDDHDARLWDAHTGKAVGKTMPHKSKISRVCFSPKGNLLVTASWDGTAQVWAVPTGQKTGVTLRHPDRVEQASFSPDGSRILTTCADRAARLWVATSGQLTATLRHEGRLHDAAFNPDGKTVATTCSDGTARIWSAQTGTPVGRPMLHKAAPERVVFSPDGRWLLTTASDGTGRLWDAATGLPAGGSVRDASKIACFSPDGRRVLTTAGKIVRVWELAVADRPKVRTPPSAPPADRGILSPDGQRILLLRHHRRGSEKWRCRVLQLATGKAVDLPMPGGDASEYALPRWKLDRGTLWWYLHQQHTIQATAFSPDGQRVATSVLSEREARIWSATSGKLEVTIPVERGPWHLCFSPNGRRLATANPRGKIAQVWDARTGKLICQTRSKEEEIFEPPADPYPVFITFSPDGRYFLTGSGNFLGDGLPTGEARLWDAATGKPVGKPFKHEGDVQHASFSPDGRRLVTASKDHTVRVWDVRTGQPLLPPLRLGGEVHHASFSADGRYIVAAGQLGIGELGEVRVWDARTGDPVTPSLRHPRTVQHATLDTRGRLLAIGWDPFTLWKWDLKADDRPIEQLQLLARLAEGFEIDATGGLVVTDLRRTVDDLRRDYRFTPRVVPAEETRVWHEDLAGEAEARNQWYAASWHLRRLVNGTSGPRLWARLGRAYGELEQWEEAARALSEAIRQGDKDPQTWFRRGRAHAAFERWDPAAKDYARAVSLSAGSLPAKPTVEELVFGTEQAHVQLAGGDIKGYRATCARLLERFGKTAAQQTELWLLIETCVLAPEAVAAPTRLVRLAERRMERNTDRQLQILRGAALLRAGQPQKAAEQLREAFKATPGSTPIMGGLFLVLADQRSGRREEAKKLLALIRKWADQNLPKHVPPGGRSDWHRWVGLRVLLREAENAVNGAPKPGE